MADESWALKKYRLIDWLNLWCRTVNADMYFIYRMHVSAFAIRSPLNQKLISLNIRCTPIQNCELHVIAHVICFVFNMYEYRINKCWQPRNNVYVHEHDGMYCCFSLLFLLLLLLLLLYTYSSANTIHHSAMKNTKLNYIYYNFWIIHHIPFHNRINVLHQHDNKCFNISVTSPTLPILWFCRSPTIIQTFMSSDALASLYYYHYQHLAITCICCTLYVTHIHIRIPLNGVDDGW